MQQRIRKQPYLAVFDGADTNAATGRRQVSMTPQQALFMMNGEFLDEQARLFAERLSRQTSDEAEMLRLAFTLALSRPPTQSEVSEALAYLRHSRGVFEQLGVQSSELPKRALASCCRVASRAV